MKKIVFALGFLMASQLSANSNHMLFLELGGPGGIGSIAYENHITDNLALRAGAGYGGSATLPGISVRAFTFPVYALFLIPGQGSHRLEAGGGILPIYFSGEIDFDAFSNVSGKQDLSGLGVAAGGVIGYRYVGDGFHFRIGGDILVAEGIVGTGHIGFGFEL